MKKIKVSFDTWIQLLGMLGVLGGLVFVGLEMQQTQKIALVSQIQERSYTANGTLNTFIEADLDWLEAIGQYESVPPLTQREKVERNALNAAWFFAEADYFQFSQGLMTDEVWQAKLRAMAGNLKSCKYPTIYETRVRLVEEAFKNLLDSLPSECD